jgi:hypothetical protein
MASEWISRRLAAGLSAVLALWPGGMARAEDAPPPADQARGLVDPHPAPASDAALVLPRVILGFPRLVFDAVNLPVIGIIRLQERHRVGSWLMELFYNDAHTAAILPVITFDSFFGAGIGVAAFHDDLFGHGERIAGSARFGGEDRQAYQLSFGVGDTTTIYTLGRYEESPELLFHGIGADGPEARFGQNRFLAILRGGQKVGPVLFSAAGLYNHRTFSRGSVDPGGSITELYDTATITGFDEGVETIEVQGGIGLETEPLRGEVFFGGVPNGAHYWHWGAELAGTLGLWAPERLLILRAAVEGVNGDEIPFTDLPRLGGAHRLRGYPLDRFRGKTALLGTIEYRYPVHQWVTGALYLDGGKVTGNTWRAGGGIGIIAHSRKRVVLTIDLAYGEGIQVMISTDPLRAFARKDTEL